MTEPMDGALHWHRQESERVLQTRILALDRVWARPPAGGEATDFYVLDMPDWVQVVPLLPDGRLVMVEQYRHGTQQVTLEFPAGIMEPGETAVEAATRELREETGWLAGSVELVGRVNANAAIQTNEVYTVVARDCLQGGQRDLDPREFIRPRLVDSGDVDGLIERGEIREAFAMVAWDFYRRSVA